MKTLSKRSGRWSEFADEKLAEIDARAEQDPKVLRVLKAVRAWSPTVFGRCDHVYGCATCELKDAIEALDAPRVRFRVADGQKWFGEICEQRVVDTNDGAETIVVRGRCGMAYRVQDALNAAEAKP